MTIQSGAKTGARRSTKRRKMWRAALLVAGAWLFYTIGRTAILLRNGQQIGRQNATFTRDYFVGKASAKPFVYVVLGDSTAAGWGAKNLQGTFAYRVAQEVSRRGFRVHVVNVAVGGARLNDVLQHQISSLETIKPQLITISVGANDATHGTSEIEYSNQLRALLARLQNGSAKTILFANTPDMFQASALPLPLAMIANKRAQRQNAILQKLTRNSSVQIVDLYNRGKLVYARDHELYAPDLFHPSGKGYALWAQLFIEELNSADSCQINC